MIILRDTREKQPWDFSWYDCEIRVATVKVGDYTIEGYENTIAVERKRSTGELAMNFGFKKKQFIAELERMQNVQYRYVVCEFPEIRLEEFPLNSGIPRKHWNKLRISGKYIRKCIHDFSSQYNVTFLFCENAFAAQDEVFMMFQNIVGDDKE